MISIQEQPMTDELKKLVYDGLSRYAIAKTGFDEKGEPIAFIAEENGTFVGTVVVALFWGALHVRYVYVEEAWRGRGLGSKLMSEAFTYGKKHNCPFAFVETMNFQAPDFYKKLGFKVDFVRSGYAHGTSFLYLTKSLSS